MPLKFDMRNALGGLISTGMPFIFKGMVNEFMEDRKITVQTAVDWIKGNKDLLTLFKEYGGQNYEDVLARAGTYVQNTDWLTSEWLIDATREEHPDIASLFLGWEEARVWLDLQTEKLRDAFSQVNNPVEKPPAPPSTFIAPPDSKAPVEEPEKEKPLTKLV
jgi:hypothetical protein